MKGKEKVYHTNLLKNYFERDEATTSTVRTSSGGGKSR